MHRVLISIAGFELSSYSFFSFLAFIIAVVGSFVVARKRGFAAMPVAIMLISMSVSAFIGARALHIATNIELYERQPWRVLDFSMVGFSIYGGILAAVLAAIVCARILKLDIWRLGDTMAPVLGASIATMRIGCFLNGCCFGRETNLPWGVTFPFMSYAHKHQLTEDASHIFYVSPVHPTQVYEFAYALMGAFLAVFIMRKQKIDGMAILAFGIWYTSFRLVNYYLRVPPATFDAPQFLYPLIYVFVIVIMAILMIKRSKEIVENN